MSERQQPARCAVGAPQRVSHELWISDERAPFSTTDLAVLTAVAPG
jgi:hypothetical protein